MLTCIVAAIALIGNLDVPAQPLPAAVKAAGKAFGENWDAARSLDRICLLIHAPGATAQEVKAIIAEAEHGSWSANGGDSLLARTREQQIALRGIEQTRLFQAIEHGMADTVKPEPFVPRDVSGNVKLVQEQMRENHIDGKTIMALTRALPAGSYIKTALHDLNPKDLCVGLGKRVVYSTQPNRLQVQLPGKGDLLSNYSRDLDKMRSYIPLADRQLKTDNSVTVVYALEVFSSREKIAKLCLSVQRVTAGSGDSLACFIFAVGAAGKVLDQGFLRIPIVGKAEVPNQLTTSTKQISLSTADLVQSETVGQQTLPPAEANPGVDLALQGVEPLSSMPSRLLTAVADAENLKLLAILPDSVMDVYKTIHPKSVMDVRSVVQAFADTGSVDFKIKDGWLIVTPIYPIESQTQFVDRPALRRLLMSTDRGDSYNGADFARFYTANPTVEAWYPLTRLVTAFWGNDLASSGTDRDAAWFRFYATIADLLAQPDSGTLSFDRLTLAQLGSFSEAALAGNGMGPQVGLEFASAEPTEYAADPRSGSLKWNRYNYNYLSFAGDGPVRGEMNLSTLVELENNVVSPTSGVSEAWRTRIRSGDYQSVQAQARNDLTIHISLGGQELKYLRILDRTKLGSPVKTPDLLPAEIVDQLDSLRKNFQPPPSVPR